MGSTSQFYKYIDYKRINYFVESSIANKLLNIFCQAGKLQGLSS